MCYNYANIKKYLTRTVRRNLIEAKKASDVFFHSDNEFFLLEEVIRATRAGGDLVVWFDRGTAVLSNGAEIERFTKVFTEMLESGGLYRENSMIKHTRKN